MNYIKFTEHNDHEGEIWIWFLQYEGNEEALKKLRSYIVEHYNDDEYEIDLDERVPENIVDILEKNSPCGYFPTFNKCPGKLDASDFGDPDDNPFYKGQISEFIS